MLRGVTSLMAPPGLPVVGYPDTGASGAKGVCHGIVAYPLNTPLATTLLSQINLHTEGGTFPFKE